MEEDNFEDANQNQAEGEQQQEVQPNQAAPEAAQGNANAGNMANNGVHGGQLSAIPTYTGNRGIDALTYLDTIDSSIPQFGWTQAQVVQAAATRGGAAMSTWVHGEKSAGVTYNTWKEDGANQTPLKPALLARFGPIENMTIKRAKLDKEVMECLLLAPKEGTPVHIEAPQDTDKVKSRRDLKPKTLTNDATQVEFRIWTKELKVFFRSSNLGKGDRIEQQQALIKLINSVLAAKLC